MTVTPGGLTINQEKALRELKREHAGGRTLPSDMKLYSELADIVTAFRFAQKNVKSTQAERAEMIKRIDSLLILLGRVPKPEPDD